MKKGAEIVVCTPGRMIDLLTANSGRVTNLKRATYLVLDEADRMFDMGFEPQVMKIVNNIRPDRQTVLFSATFPKQMDSLARKILRKPLELTVGGRSVVAPEIDQIVEVRAEDTKFNRLLEILGQMYNEDAEARTLIFVDRQEAADSLLRELMRKGYLCMSLHGGKDQVDRDQTIADFKSGVVPVVCACRYRYICCGQRLGCQTAETRDQLRRSQSHGGLCSPCWSDWTCWQQGNLCYLYHRGTRQILSRSISSTQS
jgi:ATP-dependent RNA helicase DDX46/PRP5